MVANAMQGIEIVALILTSVVLCIGALIFSWHSRQRSFSTFVSREAYQRCFWLFVSFLVSAFVISLLIALQQGSINGTTFASFLKFGFKRPGADSWAPMAMAIDLLRTTPDIRLYDKLFFENHIKFQYPPTALLFLDIPQRIFGSKWEEMFILLNRICWICVLALSLVVSKLFSSVSRAVFGVGSLPIRYAKTKVAAMSLASVICFYPILHSYSLGQIQTPITLLAGLALVAWRYERFGVAGFLVGLCCGIKPQWIILIVWALLRKQWRFVTVASLSFSALLIISVFMYGPNNVTDYFPALKFLSQHGEGFYPNQSVNGLLNRALHNGNNIAWEANSFPPFHAFIYFTTAASSALILGAAIVWRIGKHPNCIDFSLIMLSLTMASPIAWEHHYGILLPIFAIAIPLSMAEQTFGRWTEAYLLLAIILTSQAFHKLTNQLADTPLNILQSYLFFGALMVLLLLYKVSRFPMTASHHKISTS
jgi:alpha-1,2-mannosyltransferase